MQYEMIEMINGKRVVTTITATPEMKKIMAEARDFWKEQEKKSGNCNHANVQYYADGEHPECSKHCYACTSCKAIVQVG